MYGVALSLDFRRVTCWFDTAREAVEWAEMRWKPWYVFDSNGRLIAWSD